VQSEAQVIYVFDAYCGWCHGFGPTVEAFWELNRGRISFTAISGGLFLGDRRQPLRTFGYLGAANARITQLTGAKFGDAYQRVLQEGRLVLDSEAAAAGYAALREQVPGRAVEIANAVHRAFFERGQSLSDVETFARVARDLDLDDARTRTFIGGAHGRTAALHDFSLARALGANAFPAVLVATEHVVTRLGGVGTSAELLTRQLDNALEASQRAAITL
jgi:putative protein-disulfide isomerase